MHVLSEVEVESPEEDDIGGEADAFVTGEDDIGGVVDADIELFGGSSNGDDLPSLTKIVPPFLPPLLLSLPPSLQSLLLRFKLMELPILLVSELFDASR